jgi:hypothetical protein
MIHPFPHLSQSLAAMQARPKRVGELGVQIMDRVKGLAAEIDNETLSMQSWPQVKAVWKTVKTVVEEFGPGALGLMLIAALHIHDQSSEK